MISSLPIRRHVLASDDYGQFVASLTRRSTESRLKTHANPDAITAPGGDALITPAGFESWLPFAAKHHHISPDIKDYFFRPVILFLTDLPNRNGVSFPSRELARWSEEGGCQAFMTWRGKPLHVEHAAEDPTQAIGVIADVVMRPLRGYGSNKLWKVIALAAVDRTKRTSITSAIESGKRNTWSMGALVEGYTCSYCGAEVGECVHIDKDAKMVFYELNGKLVYKEVYGIGGVELSSVEDPAYGVALSDVDHIRY